MKSHLSTNGIAMRVAKSKWSWILIFLLLAISIYAILSVRSAIDRLEYAMSPPTLPEYQDVETLYLNARYEPGESSQWFYHASQGTVTLPIPYDWLIALEAPKSKPWFIFWGKEDLFVKEYLLRFGFIRQPKTEQNPDGLPIGFAITPSIYFPSINRRAAAAGFTCAACHTGQLIYDDKRYVVDGGPATVDLGQLTKALGAALGQTALSSEFLLFNGRFERFAKNVLGNNDNVLTRKRLKAELSATLAKLAKEVDVINVTEGFGRLDALNRIGNQVFSSDMNRPSNYSPINAPVNFPHIWTTPWFDWVQYDGSIMQPLVRNSGEALGVKAFVDTEGPDAQRFASSVDVPGLVAIESWIAGSHPLPKREFNGLDAPKWPTGFPKINETLAEHGAALYKELCQGCHLPPVNSNEFWDPQYWQPIKYVEYGEAKETPDPYLTLNIIPLDKIGTDVAQAEVLPKRTVDTTGLNLDVEICTPLPTEAGYSALEFVKLGDSATSMYGLALGAFVQRVNTRWFEQNFVPPRDIPKMEGERPNCLQVSQGYKARPLNGVWATAPFLHNGSIATVYDLLSTQKERPRFIELGSQKFDPERLGLAQSEQIVELNKKAESVADYVDGLFILDTHKPGNRNTGHIFDDEQSSDSAVGRIGRRLDHQEKMAVIEYLKTL
jgi:hypothetical protein